MLDTGALNPVVSVSSVERCGWRSVVRDETGGCGPEGVGKVSEEDDGAAGSVRDSEGIGAVDVTGAGGAAREDVEEDSADEAGVAVDAPKDGEDIGGAPDTAEVLEGDRDVDVLELSGRRDSDELNEAVEAAAVTEDGGACGEPIGGLVRVADEDEASDVPSGLSGSLVTVTQSVTDTVLLLASWILRASPVVVE